ncbi:MAG: hypothetical protein HKN04_05750, partial [Rhodothermaceae bacterium]|nr:hypothetical protein [Rhodothermaceae bacterium]
VIYEGLATPGLHVALSRGEPRGHRYAYGMLPADRAYDRTSRCRGAHASCLGPNTYDGDFFGPDTTPQLAPWTRPTSGGFPRSDQRPEDTAPVWFALDAMRYASDDPDSTMRFDFIADVRRRPDFLSTEAPWPVFRADAWLGPDFDGLVFMSEALAESGVTVYLGANDVRADSTAGRYASLGPVRLTFAEGLRLEPGARLVVGPEAEVLIERGVLGGPGAVLVVEPGARVTLGRDVRVEGARLEGEPNQALRRRFRGH